MAVRIVPRFIRQRKMNLQKNGSITEPHFTSETGQRPFVKEAELPPTKPESNDMMVLGQIIREYKTFGEIRKKTGFSPEELDSILKGLEMRGLMRVEQKKGLVGIKVELYPTEKGYREYESSLK